MNSVFILIPISIGILVIAVVAFLWAVRSGQFDDIETPALRILDDDDQPRRFLEESDD